MAYRLPGLVAWVHAVPSGSGGGGGDVHYLSVCPSCVVSRVALADVSGHGNVVVELGRDGLMSIARGLEASSAEAFGSRLAAALRRFRGGAEPTDEESIIVLECKERRL